MAFPISGGQVGGQVELLTKATIVPTINNTHSNTSGFNALPGGFIYHSGIYFEKGIICRFWTSKERVPDGAWDLSLFNTGRIYFLHYYEQVSGFSVRCLKNN